MLVAQLLLLAAPADAADPLTLQAQTPGGQTVKLTVRESDGGVRCLSIAVGDEGPRRTSPCAAPPRDPDASARGLHVVYRAAPEKLGVVHGLVSPDVAELRVRLGDGRLVTIRPRNGAYLHVVPGRAPVASVNAHDGTGRLVGAADLDPRAVRKARGPFKLASVPDERGRRARLTAFDAKLYRRGSTRRSMHTCMAIVPRRVVPISGYEPGYSGGVACTEAPGRVVVRYAAGCHAQRLLLYGLVPTAVRRMTLFTTSGARIPATMARLPRRLRHRGRAFVISRSIPGRLERLDAYAGNGARLASLPLSDVGSGCVSISRS